jgi:voltage-gated potassium channel
MKNRPFVMRFAGRELTARRAGTAIALVTLATTLAGGLLITIVDQKDFPTLGQGMWWAVQTVTTVGYGDVVPTTTEGRAIGTVVMVTGIGFLSVVTAAITATFVESARRRFTAGRHDPVSHELEKISERLDRIDARLDDLSDGSG